MGWGVNSEDVEVNAGNNVEIMKQVKLNRVTDRDQCLADIKATDKVANNWELDDSWICAKKASSEVNNEDINLCRGDGGGPLVCQEQGTDRNVLAGIIAFGIGCGNSNVPDVFCLYSKCSLLHRL